MEKINCMKDIMTLKQMICHLFYILNKKQRMQMIVLFIVIFIGSLLELLGVSAMLPFVQSILSPEELMNKSYIVFFVRIFNIVDAGSVIVFVGIGIIVIYMLKNAYLMFSSYLQAYFGNKTKKELSILMLRSYINRPYSFFIDQGTAKISQGVSTDTNGVYMLINNSFLLISEFLTAVSIAFYLIVTDWIMATGVIIVGSLCALIIVFGLKSRISRVSSLYRSALVAESKWFHQIVGGIKDILIYCKQNYFMKGYEDAYEESCKSSTYYTFIQSVPERVIETFCVTGILITVLVRLKIGTEPEAFVPSMAVFAMGAFRLLPSISRSTGYVNRLVYYRPFLESAYENMKEAQAFQSELEERTRRLQEANEIEDFENDFKSDIRLSDIRWKYKEGKEEVLKGLSLTINKGEAIGIIGSSGAGKSTLGDILLRLYHPQQGEVLMDGIDIDAIPNTWSRVIGYVPQAVFLVDDTVRENVVFGSENVDDKKVWNALEKASLTDFVRGLPNGLDTLVGERGVKFSGGQRQRIAIARALYDNPQIMILDEATSALDNETEEAVMEAIESLAGSMTLIIIAHRVTTLKSCDRIYEIIDGKAIERDKAEVITI